MKRILAAAFLVSVALGAHAGDFALTDTRGVTHTLSGHAGKWVVVNVWATWCAPCVQEMPELDSLARARPDVVVLGLAADDAGARRVLAFAERMKVSYPIVAGTAASAAQFGARAFPTTVLYAPDGRRVMLREGRVTRAQLEAEMPPQAAARQ